jgi:ABC-type glutathione transport system ATPase component
MPPAPDDLRPMIEIADLWKSFGRVEVLKGVSLRVGRGAVVALIGPSGSGKSTLLRCINCSKTPTAAISGSASGRCGSAAAGAPVRATAISPASAPRPAWCFSISTCSRT